MTIPQKIDVAEYYRLGEAGILPEDTSVELIKGEIIWRSRVSTRHASCLSRLHRLLYLKEHDGVSARPQNPVRLNEFSEPIPDALLVKYRADHYEQAHPTPDDVLVIVEVADTTLAYDRGVKVPLYARAGIPEVWLVDLQQERIEIYSRPAGGQYQQTLTVGRGESFASSSVAGLSLAAEDILG